MNTQPTTQHTIRPPGSAGSRLLISYLPELEDLARRRWDACVTQCLLAGPMRFTELATAIRASCPAIGDSALTQSLRRLDAAGLIKSMTNSTPASVWALTDEGRRHGERLAVLLEGLHTIDSYQPPQRE